MIGKHFLCRDPKCKICAERMADKIIKEESEKFYPGRGEMTEADFLTAMAEKKFPAHIRLDWDAKEYTKEDMIRAFVRGAKYGKEYRADDFGADEKQEAEIQAHWLLKIGKLGMEGE